MKSGSKYLAFSRGWAFYKQRHKAYCFWVLFFITACVLGFVLATPFHFENAYVIVGAVAITMVIAYFGDSSFFTEAIIVNKQLHWLEKYKKDYLINPKNEYYEEELKDINFVISELSDRMQVLSIG